MNYSASNTQILKNTMEFSEDKTTVSFRVMTEPNVTGNTYPIGKTELCEGLCVVPVTGIVNIQTHAETFANAYVNTKYPNT